MSDQLYVVAIDGPFEHRAIGADSERGLSKVDADAIVLRLQGQPGDISVRVMPITADSDTVTA